ncbi:MAG: CapA family protein [Clostridia bacterium]|nr:CapA family protein [Clostridia bacterium]MBR0219708.1 CapA family protein [Clostridia bacterium]
MKKMLLLAAAVLLMLPVAAFGETQTITLTCAGSFMPGSNDKVSTQAYAFHRYIEQYGFAYPFEKLQSLMGADDITLVSLECVLNDSAPANNSPHYFRGPETFAQVLPACSIEVVNLANTHTDDFGAEGYRSTTAALDAVGVPYCGTTEFGNHACFVDVKGIRVGFVGVYPYWHKDHPQDLDKAFRFLKDNRCDVIVASLHCGNEYNDIHGNIHENYGDKLKKLGANLIIGNRARVPQGLRVFDGITQLFSLGVSSYGGVTGVDEEVHCIQGAVAQFTLYFEDGKYTGHRLTLWPIHISGTSPENNYQPMLAEGEEAQEIMQRIQRDTGFTLNPCIDGQGAVQDFVPWKK